MKKILAGSLLLVLASVAHASEDARIEQLNKALEATLDARPDSLRAVVSDTIYEANFAGQIFYITADGAYLMNGELFDLKTRTNLTERSRSEGRVQLLEQLVEKEMISYKANGKEEYVITVFTDIDCGYCRRMHGGMKEMNDLGITVRYMAYPRSAPGTASFNKSTSVWCAADRNLAMTDAKLNNKITNASCDNAPIAKHQQIGQQFGVTGTPSMLLEDGTMIPGYLPPDKLLETLQEHKRKG